jgi:hypothetical protein
MLLPSLKTCVGREKELEKRPTDGVENGFNLAPGGCIDEENNIGLSESGWVGLKGIFFEICEGINFFTFLVKGEVNCCLAVCGKADVPEG